MINLGQMIEMKQIDIHNNRYKTVSILIKNIIQLKVLETSMEVIMFLWIYTVHIEQICCFSVSTVNLVLPAHIVICYWMCQFLNVDASSNVTN